ncbi:MAG: hypothetical protein R3D55_24820 [Chloroflexota bacterium]
MWSLAGDGPSRLIFGKVTVGGWAVTAVLAHKCSLFDKHENEPPRLDFEQVYLGNKFWLKIKSGTQRGAEVTQSGTEDFDDAGTKKGRNKDENLRSFLSLSLCI